LLHAQVPHRDEHGRDGRTHDEAVDAQQAEDELEGVLADAQRARRDELAACDSAADSSGPRRKKG